MAILTLGEFEATLDNLLIRLDKQQNAQHVGADFERAHDDLRRLRAATRIPGKIKPMKPKIEAGVDVITTTISNDQWVLDSLWDLVDYLDYRA